MPPNLYKAWNVFGPKPSPMLYNSATPGYYYTSHVKWCILVIVFFVQISMNFNASVFPNAVGGIAQDFNVPVSAVMLGQMIFLFTYAIGCEVWAPWSEELGRKWVLQTSLACVNVWQLLGGFAPNLTCIIVGRALGGLSSAGGSVTLGIVADMWAPEDHQYAVNFVVLGSVLGGIVGPVAGGYIERNLHWRWNFWIQLLVGLAAQGLQLTLPETEKICLLRDEKKWNDKFVESRAPPRKKMNATEILAIWARPFKMFAFEPIVLLLSLLSGFSDALIFTCLESFKPVFSQWGYDSVGIGLSFVPIGIGYFLAFASFLYPIHKFRKLARTGVKVQPESRLWWLMYTAPFLPIGLFGFALTSGGPKSISVPYPAQFFACLIGVANFAVYMATIDYMVAAYGRYSASATGGNGMARDFLAGISAIYAKPLFSSVGSPEHHLRNASLILGAISVVFVAPVYFFYFYGSWVRSRSPFALEIEEENWIEQVRAGKMPVSQLENVKRVPLPDDVADMLKRTQGNPNYPPMRGPGSQTTIRGPTKDLAAEGGAPEWKREGNVTPPSLAQDDANTLAPGTRSYPSSLDTFLNTPFRS